MRYIVEHSIRAANPWAVGRVQDKWDASSSLKCCNQEPPKHATHRVLLRESSAETVKRRMSLYSNMLDDKIWKYLSRHSQVYSVETYINRGGVLGCARLSSANHSTWDWMVTHLKQQATNCVWAFVCCVCVLLKLMRLIWTKWYRYARHDIVSNLCISIESGNIVFVFDVIVVSVHVFYEKEILQYAVPCWENSLKYELWSNI